MDLEECRTHIDKIDRDLARLLEVRMTIVAQVSDYKEKNNLPVFDAVREEKVLEKVSSLVTDKELRPYVKQIYRCIMDESKKYEKKRMEK